MTDKLSPDDKQKQAPGYVTDISFPSGYIKHQQPLMLSYIAARAGYIPPDPTGSFRYLELGCSSGVTLNGLAAAYPEAEFMGIDLNADHCDAARQAADNAGLGNVTYLQSSFDTVNTKTLGSFNYIATNGTYSWLNPDNLNALHNIVRLCLNPGGLFYVDYMALPGAAQMEPLWMLMRALTANHVGNSVSRAEKGLELLASLRAGGARFFEQNPMASEILDTKLAKLETERDRTLAHIAHHALVEGSKSYYVSQVVEALEPSGLSFVGTADLLANDVQLTLPPALQELAQETIDSTAIELLKDIHRMQPMRQDVFIRDANPEPDKAMAWLGSNVSFNLLVPADTVRKRWAAYSKAKQFAGPDMENILDQLAQGATSLEAIEAGNPLLANAPARMLAALHRIIATSETELGCSAVLPVPKNIKTVSSASLYNQQSLDRALTAVYKKQLISPVLGGCIKVPYLQAAILSILVNSGDISLATSTVVDKIRALPAALRNSPDGPPLAELKDAQIRNALKYVQSWLIPKLLELGVLTAK